MPLYKITAFYFDTDAQYGWSTTNWRIFAAATDAKNAFIAWNFDYLEVCSTDTELVGLQVADQAGGQPSVFFAGAGFTRHAGQQAVGSFPVADGLLVQMYGGVVNKGRSEWLLHGISSSYSTSHNLWDTTVGALSTLLGSSLTWFYQFREAATPPPNSFPIVAPPAPFAAGVLNQFVRLRRVGRVFQRGGQGLRTR